MKGVRAVFTVTRIIKAVSLRRTALLGETDLSLLCKWSADHHEAAVERSAARRFAVTGCICRWVTLRLGS
jgi:hypothetical protein